MTKERLKDLRIKNNLTQEELAKFIGATKSRISEWENGRHKMSNAYSIVLENFFSKYSS